MTRLNMSLIFIESIPKIVSNSPNRLIMAPTKMDELGALSAGMRALTSMGNFSITTGIAGRRLSLRYARHSESSVRSSSCGRPEMNSPRAKGPACAIRSVCEGLLCTKKAPRASTGP
jgi:hypothetical protein